jgi:hypothetical protein
MVRLALPKLPGTYDFSRLRGTSGFRSLGLSPHDSHSNRIDIEYPFEWVDDPSYITAPPSSAIWNVSASCTRYNPTQSVYTRGVDVGLRFFLTNEACYMTPNFSNPNWTFPGPIRGISIAPSMTAFPNTTERQAGFTDIQPCCFSSGPDPSGIEYGIRSVSYSNFIFGSEVTKTCGCGTYSFCPGSGSNVSEGWVVDKRIATTFHNYTLDRTVSSTPNYCVLKTNSAWNLGACSGGDCVPNLVCRRELNV